jgi:hypothetical protein
MDEARHGEMHPSQKWLFELMTNASRQEGPHKKTSNPSSLGIDAEKGRENGMERVRFPWKLSVQILG